MKTTKTIRMFRAGVMSCLLMLLSVMGYSQCQITASIQNIVAGTNSVEFDIYLKNTGGSTVQLQSFQAGINLGPTSQFATTGGTVTIIDQANASGAPFAGLTNGIGLAFFTGSGGLAGTLRQLRITQVGVTNNAVAMTQNVDMKFCRVRFTNPTSFTANTASTLSFAPSNIGGGTAPNANVILINGATCNGSMNQANTLLLVTSGTTTLNPQATGSTAAVLSGTNTICAGASANLSLAITGGTSPYTVVYSDGTNNFTVNSYTSGSSISVSPSSTTTYSIVSVTDAASLAGTGNTGSAIVTVTPNVTPTFTAVSPVCAGASISSLPTTSDNGITGTWSPALNNAATTTYTFTPTAGQCATTTTLAITVNPNVTPTFTSVSPICAGASLSALPTTSNNGITGTWSPALDNSATTTYTFTPDAGQCATTATLNITVNPNVTPTFSGITTSICAGASMTALPTTSNNGITGTWSPALDNSATTTYTFTPTAGQCSTTTTLVITVNTTNATPTFTASTTICAGAASPLPVTSNEGFTGSWSPAYDNANTTTYTFTPDAGQCASTATLTITVTPNVTPTFTAVAPICAGASLSALPTTSNNGYSGTWSPALNNNATTTYTFTPNAGQCATTVTLTITVNPNVTPTFTAVPAICAGASLSALPTTSNNGYTGTWSPALDNSATTTYTFTPDAGQCATTATLTITVNPNVTPTFTAVPAICAGASLSALPTTSNNGYTGTWSPSLDNNATTTYTFTPDAGQCATTATLTITVNPNVTPTFNAVSAICAGASLSALPTTSNNGITGTWSPALDNNATTIYTFTPTAGQCATTATLTITVNPILTPSFTSVAPVCAGATMSALPTTSNNGVTGTWSPALNNAATTTYTFTPTAGQCATTTTLSITVSPNVTPTFTAIAPVCSGASLSALPTTSNNGITGTWSPALDNTATTTYTFTPTAGLCATTATLTITVNALPTVTAANVSGCLGSSIYLSGSATPAGGVGTYSVANPYVGPTTTYTYTYTDANGCAATSAPANITSAACAFTVGIQLDQQISCFAADNGSILATATPASANYIYIVDNDSSTINTTGYFDNLSAIIHTVCVVDTFNPSVVVCNTIQLTEPALLTASLVIDSTVSCLGNDGQISVLITGGTNLNQGYLTWWTNANGDTLNDVSQNNYEMNMDSLTAGFYTVVVEDDHYCFATDTITIGYTQTLAVTATYPAIPCYGGTTLVTPATTGGTGTVVNTITGGSFTVGIGTYVITATDAKGCTATTVITIAQPTPVISSATVTSNYNGAQLSCATSTDGVITAGGTGGTGAYTYSIDGGAYQASSSFTGLAAGTYTISTKDANGCSATSTATITAPPAMNANAIVSSNYNGAQLSCALSTDGKITASGTGGSGGTANYTYAINGGSFQSSTLFTGLAAGIYTVTVKDINGCSATVTKTITAPTVIVASAVVTSNYNGSQISCTSSSDGKIVASATGGTGSYTYSKNGGAYQVLPTFTGLTAGTYTMTSKDANGCTATTTVTITAPIGIAASATVTSNYSGSHISCTTSADGQVTASATGGTGTYNYKINSGTYQTSPVFNSLAAGVYTITAKDVNGCSITTTVAVVAPAPIVALASVTSNYNGSQLSCNLSTDGQITASGTGGSGAYTYKMDLGAYQASAIFTNLAAGIHTVFAKDANGCFASTTITIVAPAPIVAGAVVSSNYNGAQLSCNSATDGQITANATGGTGAYAYKIDAGSYQTSNVFAGLAAGTHTVSIMDANSCSASVTITIAAPTANAVSAIVTSNYNGAQLSCSTSTDGKIQASSTGGTGAKTYSVDGGAFQSASLFLGQAAGTHTITVKDANGCTATNTVTITAPSAIVAGGSVTSNFNGAHISCATSTDGVITASGTGGTGAYTYSVDNGSFQSSTVFSGLAAGVHTITTKDINACTATFNVTIVAPTTIVPSATVVSNFNGSQLSCTTSTDGEIFVSATGGTGSYSYKLNAGVYQTNSYFNGLGAGTYTITSKDANGCTATTTVTITAPVAIAANSLITTPVSCSGGTAEVTVSATGGTGAYTGIGTFTVAVGGPYVYNVSDVNGCSTTTSISVTQPALINTSSNVSSCNSYTWVAASQVYTGSGAYVHTFITASGCDSVHTLNLTILNSTSSTTNVSTSLSYTWNANGVTYTTSGTYVALLTNAAGCDSNLTLNLTILTGVTVAPKLILGGAYDAASGLMHDSLRVQGQIPSTEPYSGSPWFVQTIPSVANGGNPSGETVSQLVLSVTGNDAIVDWVYVELRSPSNPGVLVATKRALLQRDGDVVSTDGISPVFFKGVASGNYFVSVKHRNHLGVMSASALPLSFILTNVDFSSPSFAVYTNPSITVNAPRKIVGTKALLLAGDANSNKNVKYNGLSNDKDPILLVVGSGTQNNTVFGYRNEDVNMDGKVRYNNADNDKNFINLQIGVANPNLVLSQHTPN